MIQAACYQIYSQDAAALAAFLGYLLEVDSWQQEQPVSQFVVATQPPIKIKSYTGPPLKAVSPSAEQDALLWQLASPDALEQIMQRAAFFQYRQQQEGTAPAILQSQQITLDGRPGWQMLDLDGRRWSFVVAAPPKPYENF